MAAMYEQRIDSARKIVALIFGLCGAGLVVCANRATHLRQIVRQSPAGWEWGAHAFAIAMLLCLAVVIALVVEGILRFLWVQGRRTNFQFSL
jgi:hypothetical protein